MGPAMMERRMVGEVFKYFGKAGVVAVRFTEPVHVGDRLQYQGPSTNFDEVVASMQIDGAPVPGVAAGQEAGIKVTQRCREGDLVYRM